MTLRHKQACAACARVRVLSVSHQRVSHEREPGETQHALRCNLNTPPEAQGHAATARQLLCTPEGPKGLVQRPEVTRQPPWKSVLDGGRPSKTVEDRLRHRLRRYRHRGAWKTVLDANIRECSRMFSNVLECSRMFFRMFSNILECSPNILDVREGNVQNRPSPAWGPATGRHNSNRSTIIVP